MSDLREIAIPVSNGLLRSGDLFRFTGVRGERWVFRARVTRNLGDGRVDEYLDVRDPQGRARYLPVEKARSIRRMGNHPAGRGR